MKSYTVWTSKDIKIGHVTSLFSYIETVSTYLQKLILYLLHEFCKLNLKKELHSFQSYPGKSQVKAKPVVYSLLIDNISIHCKTGEIRHDIVSIIPYTWFEYLKKESGPYIPF